MSASTEFERSFDGLVIKVSTKFVFLGDRIRDLGKGAFGMWAFIAHGGLSKPTVQTEPLNLFRASKNTGPIFLEKKGACGNVPTSSGLPKILVHFSEKKKRLRQRSQPFRASRNMEPFVYVPFCYGYRSYLENGFPLQN